ncbi:hypothetical protein KY342_02460 [Candidatus Woesearchaeota archaeon]|nr:hypothetical protein [Candidatus Woesearchaeota archaeon]
MKKILILLLILMILPKLVFSETKNNLNLEVGESIIIGGKNFTLVTIGSNNKMLFKIDNEKYFISTIEPENFEGLHFSPGIYYEWTNFRDESIEINISIDYTCGNDECESPLENSRNCCADCNCSNSYVCYEKSCVKSEDLKCYNDEKCEDEDPCTKDYCSDFPKLCYNEKITECIHNDSCCPNSCNTTEDEDCQSEKPICKLDIECNDNNISTIDRCNSTSKLCFYELNSTVENNSITENKTTEVEENQITGKIVEKIEKRSFFRELWEWTIELFT